MGEMSHRAIVANLATPAITGNDARASNPMLVSGHRAELKSGLALAGDVWAAQ